MDIFGYMESRFFIGRMSADSILGKFCPISKPLLNLKVLVMLLGLLRKILVTFLTIGTIILLDRMCFLQGIFMDGPFL